MSEAGVPEGVANLVNGIGEETGKALTEHATIRAVAFVGESATGSAIMAQGAPTLKRVHFELGGKNPVIVFADADLDRALDAAVFMIYSLNGERCTSSVDCWSNGVSTTNSPRRLLNVPKPSRWGTPGYIHRGRSAHSSKPLDKVMSYMGIAAGEGVNIAAGGAPEQTGGEHGNFVAPTLFTGAQTTMRVAQEEILAPC